MRRPVADRERRPVMDAEGGPAAMIDGRRVAAQEIKLDDRVP